MTAITLVFPDQLFDKHPALDFSRPVYIVEEFLFFRVQLFHKQRLVLLRAAMKAYANDLTSRGYTVFYVDSLVLKKRGDLFTFLNQQRIHSIHLADFADDWLKSDLETASNGYGWSLCFYTSPMFICSEKEVYSYFKSRKNGAMAHFYADQRKRLNILMSNGSPLGGKFSFDQENRKRLPKGYPIPPLYSPSHDLLVKEAIDYVEKEFIGAIGEPRPFLYPTTFAQARNALADFIQNKLRVFGDYEDAIDQKESFLFHSVLSPLLNIGLLTPQEVIEAVLSSYEKDSLPLNSVEGFVRQIIGWREFVRGNYLVKGRSERTSNYFNHTGRLPNGFWDGTTGIPPVDQTIRRILKTGYCHHIERLMILGNFLLLTECEPNAVYEWFMAYFVDAYDWVMVPNIYVMSQYADEGSFTTKPYISGSNYILKMSNYSKGEWTDLWDGLFWRFLKKHRPLFEKNPRTKVLLNLLDTKAETIFPKIRAAEEWLAYSRE